jgi:hypothetical protein
MESTILALAGKSQHPSVWQKLPGVSQKQVTFVNRDSEKENPKP